MSTLTFEKTDAAAMPPRLDQIAPELFSGTANSFETGLYSPQMTEALKRAAGDVPGDAQIHVLSGSAEEVKLFALLAAQEQAESRDRMINVDSPGIAIPPRRTAEDMKRAALRKMSEGKLLVLVTNNGGDFGSLYRQADALTTPALVG